MARASAPPLEPEVRVLVLDQERVIRGISAALLGNEEGMRTLARMLRVSRKYKAVVKTFLYGKIVLSDLVVADRLAETLERNPAIRSLIHGL